MCALRPCLRLLVLAGLTAGASAFGSHAHAQSESPLSPPEAPSSDAPADDRLTVYLLTLGPGTHPFFKFGHNAIWIQERLPGGTSRGTVYNFGTFAFDTPALIPRFLQGRFHYWLSLAGIDETLHHYQSEDRTVVAQELGLSPEQAHALQAALSLNARPENRAYLYDYFRDNCSTRVRDALDAATGGQLRRALQAAPAGQSLRAHALRLTADLLWEYVALHFALSGAIDRVETRWDEAFVPELLRRMVREVTLDSAQGPVPFVRAEKVFYESTRPPPPEEPPARLWAFLLVGLLAGAGLFLLGRASVQARAPRVAFGLIVAVLTLVFGLLGLALLLLWALTDHRAAYANENLLQSAPFLLLAAPAAIGLALGHSRALKWTFRVLAAAALASFAGLAVKLVPVFAQENGELVAFFLPLWGLCALGLWRGQVRAGRS